MADSQAFILMGMTVEPLWRDIVGEILRRTRQRQGRTLADVAAAAGISMQYLSEIERGRKEASSEILAAITGALGITLVDLTVGVASSLTTPTASSQARSDFCLAA